MSAVQDPGRAVPPDLVERRTQPVDLLVRARRVVLPDGERAAAIAVRDGRIASVEEVDVVVPARSEVLLGDDEVLLPGLVDTHVHLQEPGRDGWEGFASGTRAAVAGGITTLVDMPLDSLPVTIDVAALEAKRAAAAGSCFADVAFWGGIVPASTAEGLVRLHEAGVVGFKAYLADSGLEQFPPLSTAGLVEAGRRLAGLGTVVLVHAELPQRARGSGAPVTRYADHLAAHPATEELRAVEAVIAAVRRGRTAMHVVHVSAAASAERVAMARAAGDPVSAETCPHYLTLAAETVPDDAAVHLVSPPVRESLQREGLWQALRHGSLGMVVSDHSPVPDADKRGGLSDAAPGIGSLQLSLPLVWTGARARGFALTDVVAWMSAAPAALAGLSARKGAIAVGLDADLVAFAPDEEFVVTPARLWHRQASTPYAGALLRGGVRRTWLRGVPVDLTVPRGRLLKGRDPCASS